MSPPDHSAPAAQLQNRKPGGAVFTLSEAATACSISLSTIKRRHRDKAFPNAYQDAAGTWRIPLTDLLAAGLTPNKPQAKPGSTAELTQPTEPPTDQTDLVNARATIERLTTELAEASAARRVAEARAEVYERVQDDLRTALRALSGPAQPSRQLEPAKQADTPHTPAIPTPAPSGNTQEHTQRRWWQIRGR